MNEATRGILDELKVNLRALYGGRWKGVFLFGSYARQQAEAESDMGVLIVLDQVDHYSREIARTSETIAGLSLQHGIALSRVFASEAQWREDQTLFFLNVREEAVPA